MNREEVYQRFGPKLIEALALVILDEINILRVEAGLPERTSNQIIEAIGNRLEIVVDYLWMAKEV